MLFATSRYEFLNELMKKMDAVKEEWCERWRKTPIELKGNPLNDVQILKRANAERLGDDYYIFRLEEIEKAISVEVHGAKNKKTLDAYRDMLKEKLETMDLDYEPDESDGVDPAYMYQNEHIFEPEKGMLEWAVNSLKTRWASMLIWIPGRQSRSYRLLFGLVGGCMDKRS